jgi:hypothetical protein
MAAEQLDEEFVAERTRLVTRGYRRLHEINEWPDERDLTDYPLPEMVDRYR